jgi:hypothetical protein
MNSCGGCTACCSSVPVKEIGLRQYQRCPHLREVFDAKGPGCGIYANRPYSCSSWACLWLKSDWPAELRPDRLGIVVDEIVDIVKINGEELPAAQIWVLPGHDDDWRSEAASNIIAALVEEQGTAVVWRMAPGTHAIVFWRNPATGNIERSEPHRASLDALGPDSTRLARAGEVYVRHQQRTGR